MRFSHIGSCSCTWRLILLVPVVATLLAAGDAPASDGCLDFTGIINDWSGSPPAMPTTLRAQAVEVFTWKGNKYLVLNSGNGIRFYSLASETAPTYLTEKKFVCGACPAKPPGDYDWVQYNVSMCDECRYGLSHFWQAGMAVFDLGSTSTPSVAGATYYEASAGTIGGFTFSHGTQQYLVINYLDDRNPEKFPNPNLNCGSAHWAKLYMVNGTDGGNDLIDIQCVETSAGQSLNVINGLHLVSGSQDYVYLIDYTTSDVHIFKVTGSGSNLKLQWQGAPLKSFSKFGTGLRADVANDLLVTGMNASPSAKLWDIADLSQPVHLYTFDQYYGTDQRGLPIRTARAAIAYPIAWFGTYPGQPTYTFDISNPVAPQPLDEAFWSPDNAWNSTTAYPYLANTDAIFSPSGSNLYVARFSVFEMFDVGDCGPDVAPTAALGFSPTSPFPGDNLTVNDTSSGLVEASALWITDASGAIVVGDSTLASGTPRSRALAIPDDLAWDQSYTAHVAVENSSNPYNPQAPGSQLKETAIQINRAPQAAISITPDPATTNETLTLSAAGSEGTPESYQWDITPPSAAPWQDQGQQIQVPLGGDSGQWSFKVTAAYKHSQEVGGLYSDDEQVQKTYSSIAADFKINGSYTPTPICSDASFTLNASVSQTPLGADLSYAWTIGTMTPNCPADAASCTISAGTLTPSTYNVKLLLTNNDNGDQSDITRQVTITDCSFNPSISAAPDDGGIGDIINFTIGGITGAVEKAVWNFGGQGCDNRSPNVTCTPGIFGCESQTFKYASSGNKSVTVQVTVGGVTKSAATTITIANTGSCGGTVTCDYTLSPSSKGFSDVGGSYSFSVSASQSSCTWSASTSASWIHITAGSGTVRGNGTVSYRVDTNTGAQRNNSIRVGSAYHNVSQSAATVSSVDFNISNTSPEIGEQVVFTATSGTPVRWDFGGMHCDNRGTDSVCSGVGNCSMRIWEFNSSGQKTVRLTAEEGTVSKTLTVQNTGTCSGDCELAGAPTASFQMSPTSPIVGQPVTFTDSSVKAGLIAGTGPAQSMLPTLDFEWAPEFPEIGQEISFMLTETTDRAEWDFGEVGCSQEDYPRTYTCQASLMGCRMHGHAYASGGDKSVSVTVKLQGNTYTLGPKVVTVADTGNCPGTACSYSLNRSSESFTSAGGTGTVTVTTGQGCSWTAASQSSWISILSGASGTTSGSVTYKVAENTGSARTGRLLIAGQTFNVSQDPGSSGGGTGTAPDSWLWQVKKSGQDLFSRTTSSFTYTFTEVGSYTVKLTVSNCKGSDSYLQAFDVVEYVEPDDHVIPAAAHAPGINNTKWLSDVKVFNPTNRRVSIDLKYLPESQSIPYVPGFQINLEPYQTRIFPDVLMSVPGISGEALKGGLLFVYDSDTGEGQMPAIMSRTFNDTPLGTFGQFVPAVPMVAKKSSTMYFTGLKHNSSYRTNLGLANPNDEFASGLSVTVLSAQGDVLGQPFAFGILKNNTIQISNILSKCGVSGDLDLFSLEVDTGGNDVVAYISIVDNISGDPFMHVSRDFGAQEVVIPGVAHAAGLNDSVWRTEITLFNPTDTTMTFHFLYVPEADIGYQPYYDFTLEPKEAWGEADVLSLMLGGAAAQGTKGYIKISGTNDSPAPQVAARTYNQTLDAGTFGQAIPAFSDSQYLALNEIGFLPGVSNSASDSEGFRANVGLVNLDTDGQTKIDITVYDEAGESAGFKRITLAPGAYRQFNLFGELAITGDFEGSAVLEVYSGGPAIAYASVVENRTGDSFFMQLQKAAQH